MVNALVPEDGRGMSFLHRAMPVSGISHGVHSDPALDSSILARIGVAGLAGVWVAEP